MRISTDVRPGSIIIVRLEGRLDQLTASVVQKRLSLFIQMGYRRVIVVLDGILSLEKEGLDALSAVTQEAQQVGSSLQVAHPYHLLPVSPHVGDTPHTLRIYPTVDAALADM